MHGQALIEVCGSGPDLVMIHGWGMHKGVWGGFAERLSRHFRLHLVDLPGHGEASRGNSQFECLGLAKHIASQTPPAAWMGWSLGGQIALKAALAVPDAVKKLILLSTNPSFVKTENWECAQDSEVFAGFSESLGTDATRTLQKFERLQVAGSVNSRSTLRQLQSYQAELPSIEALQVGLDILLTEDQISSLCKVNVPCLLAGGSEDRIVPIEALREMAKLLPHAELHELEGAGHMPFISHEDGLARLIVQFVKRKKAA